MATPGELKAEILPDDYNQYDLSFKMIVIGDAGVGKSCLTSKAAKGIFDENYSATVGFEFLTFNVRTVLSFNVMSYLIQLKSHSSNTESEDTVY